MNLDGSAHALSSFLQLLAHALLNLARPVYLRVGYEFNGEWNSQYMHKATYPDAFRRITQRLTAAGVNNTAYVWDYS